MSRATKYRVSADVLSTVLKDQGIANEAVLLHMETKDYFRLNQTAAVVWEGLERGMDREALLAKLTEEFEVEPGAAADELDRLLDDLTARGLVVAEA